MVWNNNWIRAANHCVDYTSMISQTQETQQSMKHDPRSEPLPMVTTNRAAFLFAEKIAGSIPKDIMSIIERSTYGDEDFAFLKDQANNTAKVYTSTEIRVGLKGDSGTGKSSLINSLLGYDGIAPSVCPFQSWLALCMLISL